LNTFSRHGGQITKYRKTNGMSRPEIRAKVSTKLRAMGWGPPVRGGNGHGPTHEEMMLACSLGWKTGMTVTTHVPKYHGIPTHYKLDVANEELKVAIEVDGMSHNNYKVRANDRKKDKFLSGLGWTVLRFKNRQVREDLKGCVQTVLSTISKLPARTPTA